MIGKIDARGTLRLCPENETEAYALTKWWEDWQNQKVILTIETPHPHISDTKSVATVEPPGY